MKLIDVPLVGKKYAELVEYLNENFESLRELSLIKYTRDGEGFGITEDIKVKLNSHGNITILYSPESRGEMFIIPQGDYNTIYCFIRSVYHVENGLLRSRRDQTMSKANCDMLYDLFEQIEEYYDRMKNKVYGL